MGLKEAFEALLQRGKADRKSTDPVSMVLLLHHQHFPTLEQLRELAQRAFGTNSSGDQTARHSVYQKGVIFTLANVGPHILSFLFTRKRYDDGSRQAHDFAKGLRRPDQRLVWSEHKAFMAVDYAKGKADIESQYVVLARLCAELYDANCMGLYLPRENALLPGEENARGQLAKIVASRKVDVT